MILYFADRYLNILGQASTELPEGLTISEDLKTEDIETGVAIFECRIPYDKKTRALVSSCAEVGNYILRSNGDENEFYTIIDAEIDTKEQDIWVYAEDAGLDLLNEIVGEYEADKAYSITHYIDLFAKDSGFEIGINEATGLTKQLVWDSEATAAERIANVAALFDGCEISYSFAVKNLEITGKYINIYKERGKDIGAQLRLNYEIDRILTKKSIANLATALQCFGGTPEKEESDTSDKDPEPITLAGYKYDDGNFYVDGTQLKSRTALKKWSRYIWAKEPNKQTDEEGHIVQTFSSDALTQEQLCKEAVAELKKLSEIEVNYEIDINKLPDDVKIGDRVNIIDDEGELYVSARVLRLETSAVDETQVATLGEYLIKNSGISQKVTDLAAQFASQAAANAKALAEALAAQTAAENAVEAAVNAEIIANNAQATAEEIGANASEIYSTKEELVEGYVPASEYEEYKEATEIKLNMQAEEIDQNNVTITEQINNVKIELQENLQKIEKHFEFTENGLIISAGENTMTLEIDNDIIRFKKNGQEFGSWNGVDFYTGNVVVEVEQRAQFGNFAFLPRNDGSLMFLKVGG